MAQAERFNQYENVIDLFKYAPTSSNAALFSATAYSAVQIDERLRANSPDYGRQDSSIGVGVRTDPRGIEVTDNSDELIDAKIRVSELTVMNALEKIDSKIDRLSDRVEISVEQSRDAKAAADRAQQAASSTKWNVLATAIGVIAILFAAWAIWAQGIEMVSGIFNATGSNGSPPTTQ